MDTPALSEPTADWLEALRQRLGPGGSLRPVEATSYLEEPRRRYFGRAALIARPSGVEEVSAVLQACAAARVGVVPYGGGTGVVAGQIYVDPGPTPIILSLERMNRIRAVSGEENALTAEAGVALAEVQEAARAADRLFPLSLASEGSARIGGLLGTNAGGTAVLRYGAMRDLCLGLEAVLADGRVLRGLSSLRKDNTGFDLRNLLIGSEGALGVITAATLRLFARPKERAVALASLRTAEDAITALRRLQDALGETVTAFELMTAQSFRFLQEAEIEDVRPPFPEPPPFAALIEIGGVAIRAPFEAALAAALEADVIQDAVLAAGEAQADALWRLRRSVPLANRAIGAVASHDVSLPIERIPAFLDAAERETARLDAGMRLNVFGHLGDGNLHVNLFPARGRRREEYADRRIQASFTIHELVHAHGGSISAEHGIGRLKVEELARYGDPTKLAAMRAIKSALDPQGILNPGVLGL